MRKGGGQIHITTKSEWTRSYITERQRNAFTIQKPERGTNSQYSRKLEGEKFIIQVRDRGQSYQYKEKREIDRFTIQQIEEGRIYNTTDKEGVKLIIQQKEMIGLRSQYS